MTVKLGKVFRVLERSAEVRGKVVVLGLAGVDVDGGLVLKTTINKVSGGVEVFVTLEILAWV